MIDYFSMTAMLIILCLVPSEIKRWIDLYKWVNSKDS